MKFIISYKKIGDFKKKVKISVWGGNERFVDIIWENIEY